MDFMLSLPKKNTMKKPLKITLISLGAVIAVLLAVVLVFTGVYFTRFQTVGSIEKLTNYDDRYNLYRMDVKYNYSLDVTNLTAARQQKRFFAELAWEDSNSLTHLFGYEYITLVENYTTTNAATGITTTRQHIFDLENDFPSVFYFSGYAGFAVYMVFILYFAWLIFVGVVTRFKKLFTLESGLVYMTFALMLGVSQFSGNVLRRPNASIYMSVILAYIYYLTVIKEGVRPTDIFVWPNKKKRAARLAAHDSAASAES